MEKGVKNLEKSIEDNVSANSETKVQANKLLNNMKQLKQCPTNSTKSN